MFYPIGLMWEYIQPKGEGKVNLRKEKKNLFAYWQNAWSNQLR